jgi:hypothetical protein
MNKILIATSVFALMMGVAQAGEGNGDPFPNRTANGIVANQVVSDTGSQSTPTYGRGVTLLSQGDVLPTNGSNGIVQTANSLPRGFEDGTVVYAQAQSMQRWALAHQAVRAKQLAMGPSTQAR